MKNLPPHSCEEPGLEQKAVPSWFVDGTFVPGRRAAVQQHPLHCVPLQGTAWQEIYASSSWSTVLRAQVWFTEYQEHEDPSLPDVTHECTQRNTTHTTLPPNRVTCYCTLTLHAIWFSKILFFSSAFFLSLNQSASLFPYFATHFSTGKKLSCTFLQTKYSL